MSAARSARSSNVNDFKATMSAVQFERADRDGTGTVSIPLAEAVLCIDDDTIYAGLSKPCPRCGGKSRLVLQTILHSMACGA